MRNFSFRSFSFRSFLVAVFLAALFCQPGVPCFGQSPAAPALPDAAKPAPTLADAQQKLEHGRTEDAIAILQQLATAQPPIKGVNRELAIAFYRTGKLTEAERTFAKAMAEDPSDIESVQLRGLTLYRMGQPAAAIPYLEKVRQWTPNANADANYVLGLCYMNSQHYDQARGAFAAQYGVAQDSGAAYLLLAGMLLRADLPELAAENAQKALTVSPTLPLAHFKLGEVFLFKSDIPHALEQFEQERELNPAYPPVYDRLGDAYTRSGQYQKAQEVLTKAISLDMSSTGPFIQLGKVFLRRNDPQSAVLYLQHAEKMDPSNTMTHTLLGQAYRSLGREADAKRELEATSKINSANQLKLQNIE
ncbi:MAG TPA: tetratricopeptide repeat protein [Acidisarcina sp.]|nr:tetratricopeptide repeat protein [Acidisarcina sp.]